MSKVSIISGGEYFIRNYHYDKAYLAQYTENELGWGTYENGIYPDQLWILKEALPKYPGYYYIENWEHGYRLALSDHISKENLSNIPISHIPTVMNTLIGPTSNPRKAIVYKGNFFEDQLWKFTEADNDSYTITNFTNSKAKLAKWKNDSGNSGDRDCGVYDGDKQDDDQKWVLMPRFYDVESENVQLFSYDNKQDSIVQVKHSFNHGISHIKTESVRELHSMKASIKATLGFKKIVSSTAETEVTNEIETIKTNQQSSSFTESTEFTFQCPPKKFTTFFQIKLNFKSHIKEHEFSILTKEFV